MLQLAVTVFIAAFTAAPIVSTSTGSFVSAAGRGIYRVDAVGNAVRSELQPASASSVDAPAEIVALADAAGVVLAQDEFGRVFRSDDGGAAWVSSSVGLPASGPRSADGALALDPDGKLAYVVIRRANGSSFLYRSDDGGRNWYVRKDLGTGDVKLLELAGRAVRVTRTDDSVVAFADVVPGSEGGSSASGLPPEQRLRTTSGTSQRPDFDTLGVAVLHDDGTFIANNDTAGRRLQFTPIPNGGYDGRFVAANGVVPFGEELSLSDDSNVPRALPFLFPFFASAFNLLYVSDNGNVSFMPDPLGDAVESSELLASGPPRIAVMWDDFVPGRVYFDAQPSATTITWFQTSQFGANDFNAFQVVLEPSGRITMEWDLNAVRDGLVGLSPGGVATRFYTDLTRDAPFAVLAGAAIYEQFVPDEVQVPRVLRRFYQCHPDLFQQLAIWGGAGFVSDIAAGGAPLHSLVSNNVQGIGLPVFTEAESFGSGGVLESYFNMNLLAPYPDNPEENMRGSRSGLDLIAEQTARRWAAYIRYDDGASFASSALLGDGAGHWSFFLDSDASVLGGHDFRDDGGGVFTAVSATSRYSSLDQYLMGMRRALDVADMGLLSNLIDPGSCGAGACTAETEPNPGVVVRGNAEQVSMAQIQAIEGLRVPDANDSAVEFRQGWVLLVPVDTTVSSADLDKLDRYRAAWETYFSTATEARGIMNATMVGSPPVATGVIGNMLHVSRSIADVTLDWSGGAATRRRYVVLGTPDKSLLADTPTGIGSVPSVASVDEIERLVDPGAAVVSAQRPSLFYYEVFARDCLDLPIVP